MRICQYCDEPVTEEEAKVSPLPDLHRECAMRLMVGSVAHQEGRCSCFGGSCADDPGKTRREAAVDATATFIAKRILEKIRVE